jgi:polygalacturonase
MPYARTQNYTNSGDFLASEVNSDFDNLWLAGEQTNRSFSQSIRKPITDSDSISMELPEAASRANKYLSFGPTGAVAVQQTAPATDASAVTYTPAGTGAVDTTVQAKLRESVSVKDFGATGDGTTDDTAAIQAAIDSLSATGGQVFLPKGTYRLSASLTIDGKGIHLFGETSESTVLKMVSTAVPVLQVGGTFHAIEKVTLEHSPSLDYDQANGICLNLTDSVYHSSFRDLRLLGGAYGMKLTTKDTSAAACFSNTFDNFYIFPYSHTAIEITSVNSGSTGNVFNNIYTNAIRGGSAGNVVTGVALIAL